ncbi:MAG TPA: hypothetical protein VK445_07805, partial [Dissulfurispiraceae bacterium]|nr:hypothetical protein [Dissulfurispiraceae bacterium]
MKKSSGIVLTFTCICRSRLKGDFYMRRAELSLFAIVAALAGIIVLTLGATVASAGPGGGTYYVNSPAGYRVGPSGAYWTGTPIRKFVHTLPGLGPTNANDLGNYISVATPDTATFAGSDYYVIGLKDYTQRLHSDLAKATKLRGYYQVNGPDTSNRYLGPVIIAQKDRPVRIKFINQLGLGSAGNLFIPVDTTSMGAGMGPDGVHVFTQNRATLHLHGGDTPWISDGTPHQWTTPAGETSTTYLKGVSTQDVPDMPASGAGAMTFYYPNGQSSRLMFYHDHAYGLTRLNVYVGEAAGYLLVDPVEEGLINGSILPNLGGLYRYGVPLIIQDKTFVPADVDIQDVLWNQKNGVAREWRAVGGDPGDLWFPHVYEPNQNPNSSDGANQFGRWDYGPWFWPPVIVAPQYSTLPEPSMVPEAFMDTPIINGTPYPKLTVDPKAYRFRILNASNDRAWNLQLYYVDPANPTEVKMVPANPPANPCAANAAVNPVTGLPLPVGCWPAMWPTDGREGGVPDPATAGPKIVQIGTEGGLLPAPVEIPAQPIGYLYDRRNIVVLNVSDKALFMQPAERADIIIDFSQVPAGSKLILYSDAPAPVPGFDPRQDYYTGKPDHTDVGGTPTTQVGVGPNTRTIMLFEVSGNPASPAFNLIALQAAQSTAFAQSQPAPLIPQTAYPAPYTSPADTLARIQDFALTFKPIVPLNGSQAIRSMTVTNAGAGYTSAPAVSFNTTGAGCNQTPAATAVVA